MPAKLLITHTEFTHSPKQDFFQNLFPPTAERGKGNCNLLYLNSVRKDKDDLDEDDFICLYFT